MNYGDEREIHCVPQTAKQPENPPSMYQSATAEHVAATVNMSGARNPKACLHGFW